MYWSNRASDDKQAAQRTANINKTLADIAKAANSKDGKGGGGHFANGGHPGSGFANDVYAADVNAGAMDVDRDAGKRR